MNNVCSRPLNLSSDEGGSPSPSPHMAPHGSLPNGAGSHDKRRAAAAALPPPPLQPPALSPGPEEQPPAQKLKSGWFTSSKKRAQRSSSGGSDVSPLLPDFSVASASAVPIVGGFPLVYVGSDGMQDYDSAPISPPHLPPLPPAPAPGAAAAAPAHRRHRSLLGSLGLGRSSRQQLHENGSSEDHTDAGLASAPSGDAATLAALPLAPPPPSIESLEIVPPPPLPARIPPLGIANIGNSCFLSAALQCLRFTPGLATTLVPDLMAKYDASVAALKAQNDEAGVVSDNDAYQEAVSRLDSRADSHEMSTGGDEAEGGIGEGGEEEREEEQQDGDGVAMDAPLPAAQEEEEQRQQQEEEESHEATPPPPAPMPPRPERGELSSSVSSLFSDLFLGPGPAVSPFPLVSMLRRFPAAADYVDGRQQDCQELLQVLLDLLHEDMAELPSALNGNGNGNGNGGVAMDDDSDGGSADAMSNGQHDSTTTVTTTTTTTQNNNSSESEGMKAAAAWAAARRSGDSPISSLFMGQLQSSVVCSRCSRRFTMYEPFTSLSLPVSPKSGQSSAFAWLSLGLRGGSSAGMDIQDCLRAFTADERLEGDEAFACEACGCRTAATKRLGLHALPPALVFHIKRFRHRGTATGTADKIAADVRFPVKGLDVSSSLSPESGAARQDCVYDLYAVSRHIGSSARGHYTAACRVAGGEWFDFDDVNVVQSGDAAGPKTADAYILFYFRREFKDRVAAGEALAAAQHHHGHSRTRSGSGGIFSKKIAS